MASHISTEDTFFIDSIKINLKCPICFQDSESEIGWIGVRCGACGAVTGDDPPCVTVRKRRDHVGLSRKEMAAILGLSRKTIANYENDWPSKKYYFATGALVKKHKQEPVGS